MAPLTGDPAAQTDRPRVEDAVHSPEDIAARLRLPPPTEEQAEVVTAPLTPRLVLAGAGSGKTATMADRVVWLVANGLVRPDEVLGVTFTRKASGELAERINGRVDALLRSGLEIPGFDGEPEDLGRASVSTYHSYAGALVRDHGLRIGVEPEARLLVGADAHRLMGAVVRSHPVVADTLGVAPSRLITQALRLAGDMAEHLVTADEVREFLARLAEQGSALPLPPRAKTPSKEIQEFLTGLADRALMADLVARYDEVKREQDVMDFGDLLRHAARIAVEVPAACRRRLSRRDSVFSSASSARVGPCGSRGSGESSGSRIGGSTRSRSANRRTTSRPVFSLAGSLVTGIEPSAQLPSFHRTSTNAGALLARATMRRSQTRRATSRLLENMTRGPIAPSSSTSSSAGARTSSCRRSTTTCEGEERRTAITVAVSARSKTTASTPA